MNIEKIEEITDEIANDIKEIHNGNEYKLDLHPQDLFYVARKVQKVVGYVHARPTIGHIFAIYVHNDHRGIGPELLGKCISGLKECGITEVHVGVEPNNNKGLSFFRAQGFNELNRGQSGFTNFSFKLN